MAWSRSDLFNIERLIFLSKYGNKSCFCESKLSNISQSFFNTYSSNQRCFPDSFITKTLHVPLMITTRKKDYISNCNCSGRHKRPSERLTIKKKVLKHAVFQPFVASAPSFVLLPAEPVCACAEVARSGPRSGCRSGSSAGSDRLKATKYRAHLDCNDT